MSDPVLVRRLALDLRNLSDKTLSLRGAVEDYRHELLRGERTGVWRPDGELLAVQRQVHELWAAMDRVEEQLGDARQADPPLSWRD